MFFITAIFFSFFWSGAPPYQQPVSVGDFHNGGIVFYVDPSGSHGLIVAEKDQVWNNEGKRRVQASWGCTTTRIRNATESVVGAGWRNTESIVKACSEENTAADICWKLQLNGYDDWFLPSRDELDLIYKNLHKKGLGKFAPGTYWSSTESSNFAVWSQNFGGGAQNVIDKGNVAYVRAIRIF